MGISIFVSSDIYFKKYLKMKVFIFIFQGFSLITYGKELHNIDSVFPPSTLSNTEINIDSKSGGCCEAIAIDLSGDPAGYQWGLIGTYYLQDDFVNGRNYWIKENYAYGIWYTDKNTNAWIVGSIGNLGSST